MLGSQPYTENELLTVLRIPTAQRRADPSLILAVQLIAAKLNIANGADPTTIATTVADADRLLAGFGDKLPFAVTPSSVLGRSMVSAAEVLRSYNSGRQTPTCGRSFHQDRGRRSARRELMTR